MRYIPLNVIDTLNRIRSAMLHFYEYFGEYPTDVTISENLLDPLENYFDDIGTTVSGESPDKIYGLKIKKDSGLNKIEVSD